MADIMDLINREVAKIQQGENAYGGKSVDPALDALTQTWKMGQEERRFNAQKNQQRQMMLQELGRGTSTTFNKKDLERKKERYSQYFNKYKNSMDETTLEMGNFIMQEFDIQDQKNTDFEKALLDGENLKKDLLYDFENIGVDEEGNRRTLDLNDYDLIREQQKKWIEHSKNMQTNFSERLNMKPFQHINAELVNAASMNQFLLAQAREDDLIDDRELKAYQDAWQSGSISPINKYNNDEAEGRKISLNINAKKLAQDAELFQKLQSWEYGGGKLEFAVNDGTEKISLTKAQIDSGKYSKYPSLETQYEDVGVRLNELEKSLLNTNNLIFKQTGQDLLSQIGVDFTISSEESIIKSGATGDSQTDANIESVLSSEDPKGEGAPTIKDIVKSKKGEQKIIPRAKESLGLTDADSKALSNLTKGAVGGGVAYGIAKGTPKGIEYAKQLANATTKAYEYVNSASKIKGKQIADFMDSKDVQKAVDKIESLRRQMEGLGEDSKVRKGLEKRINGIRENISSKYSKKYNVDKKAISKMFEKTQIPKWNLFKLRAKAPRWALLQVGRMGLGRSITQVAGFEAEGKGRAALDFGVGFATEKAVTKKFFPQLMKMLGSEKGKTYLAKKVGTVASKKILGTAMTGSAIPGWGNLAMGLIGVGLSTQEIYNLVKEYKED